MLRSLFVRLGLLITVALLMIGGTLSSAQTTGRTLLPDLPVEGTIDTNNAAQVYTFSAEAGTVVSVTLTSDGPLTILLTDSDGNNLGQVNGAVDAAEVSLTDVSLANAGAYFVTIFPVAGAEITLPIAFTVTLTSDGTGAADDPTIEATPAPDLDLPTTDPTPAPTEAEATTATDFQVGQQISLPQGLQVTLRWATTDDLNLQVRDPVGETLFWNSRSTSNGGTFGVDRNGLCENIIDPPSELTQETAEWQGGGLFAGRYEILVFYRQSCGGNSTVDFTVDVTANGTPLDTINGTLLAPGPDGAATVYLGSFALNADGSGSIGPDGPYTGERELPVPAQDIINTPGEAITLNTPIQGVIAGDDYFQTYTFEGLAGQPLAISMTATAGNLDTLLLIFNSNGNIIGTNDDIIAAEITNSAIDSLVLPADGVYTIMATRYGKDVGGTEGSFELTVNSSDIPDSLLNLNLPPGNIEIYLQWDTNADLQLLVRDPFGDTVFNDNREIRSGGTLVETGNINCTGDDEDNITTPLYYTYWPEDRFLNSGAYEVEVQYRSECQDTTPVTFSLNIVVDGELVFTDSVPFEFNERYLTSFSIDADGIVAASDGGILGGSETLPWQTEIASATVLAITDSRTGSITPDQKFDLYTFSGQTGDIVTINMQATSGNLDTQLFLIDPVGIELVSNDDANAETTDSLINVTLQAPGDYVIIATHFGAQYGGTIGAYNLSLDIDRTTDANGG